MEVLFKLFLNLIIGLVCLIPLWIFLALRVFLDPHGFWQNLVTTALGIVFLGSIQLMLLVALVAATMIIWSET